MSLGLLDIDSVTFRLDGELDDDARERFDGGTWSSRGEQRVRWTGKLGPDIVVLEYPEQGQIIISGSPHKAILGESVGPFGPSEFVAWAVGFAPVLGLPLDHLLDARLSRFDIAANLALTAPPFEYIAIAEPPNAMESVGSSTTTKTFKHTGAEVTLYDKRLKVTKKSKMAHVIPDDWDGHNVLRVEVRFKKPAVEFGRPITVGMLGDPAIWDEIVQRYEHRARSVRFRRGIARMPPASSVLDLRALLAARQVLAQGGSEVLKASIDHSAKQGLIPKQQRERQRAEIVRLVEHYAPGDADLAEEIIEGIRAAVASARGVTV